MSDRLIGVTIVMAAVAISLLAAPLTANQTPGAATTFSLQVWEGNRAVQVILGGRQTEEK